MTIKIDHSLARDILIEEYQNSIDNVRDKISEEWDKRARKLSKLCPYRKSSTFIAALGTAILAKTVNPKVDVYSLLDRDGGEFSYSARSLADNVWAKNRALLGVDLGANGQNPLNNTPFIGKARIDEIKNVRNREGYRCLIECLDCLARIKRSSDARSALRAFIQVRKKNYETTFKVGENSGDYFVLTSLNDAIEEVLKEGSEEGSFAQAIAAGLLASVFDEKNIEVGKVNDPDRKFPLDILVYQQVGQQQKIRFAVEVKDKPVEVPEILTSIEKSLEQKVNIVVMLAISSRQKFLRPIEAYDRARDLGCKLIVYSDWESFIKSCLLFSDKPGQEQFVEIYRRIGLYAVKLGVSQKGIDLWESYSKFDIQS